MRIPIPRRISVVAAVGALAAAGTVVAAAPAAHAVEVTYTSQCTNVLVPTLPIPPSETKVDIEVSPAKDTYTVGDLVTVTWKWGSYSTVPDSSPIPELPADSTKPVGQINLTGAQTGVLAVEGERKNAATPKGQPLVVTDMTATMTLTAAGTVNFTPKQHSTFTQIGTFDAETQCLPTTTPGVSASITVEEGQASQPVVKAPDGELRPGSTVAVSGSNFTPGATPQVKICDTDGVNCPGNRVDGQTLAIDAGGNLSGTVALSGANLPDGNYLLAVSDGTAEGRDPITVRKFVPEGPPVATASATSGPVGTVVTISGSNWTPNQVINIGAVNSAGFPFPPVLNTRTTPDGVLEPIQYTVSVAATTHIRVRAGTSATEVVLIPFAFTAGQSTQSATVALAPGTLTMTQAGDAINFGSATLNGTEQTLNADLNQVTVTDARGGKLGWSLTGTMTDLVAANGTGSIPAGNIAWTPSCAALPDSPSPVASGTPGPLGSTAATLCSVAAADGTTGGKFTADAELALKTPAFAAAGTYTGTLTISLI
ncbi:hypothetical protein LO772_10920 [Yinghuangia sp. ASG 101]|uniref:hypothetical protein n=1 Tax=Yinghuangia sp. ASG 101 TaxID=2896848 RepID=UPI001E3D8FF8|nr:hypothetical protein [Yinghuangia sp. ASG 101]UGQ14063.1 hypothetical protein LO772_10920 [Yinghuangia sp. ASG 101]